MESSKVVSQTTAPQAHRPRLQRALLAGFGPLCLDTSSCAQLLADAFNPGGISCPSCAAPVSALADALPPRRIRCTRCGRRFTAFTGTILEGSKLTVRQAALLLILLALGHDNPTAAAMAGVSTETARTWRAKLEAE